MSVELPPPAPAGITRIAVDAAAERERWLALRQQDITASVIFALVGEHEYTTAFEQWAIKSGQLTPSAEQTDAMERGTELESVAINVLRRRQPTWSVAYPVGLYYRDEKHRIGCTPDAFATDPDLPGFGIVQVKSVEPFIFAKKWKQPDGTIEPPFWIACQALTEACLTGASWACVAALTVGHKLTVHIVPIPLHTAFMDRLRSEADAFWRAVENKQPPAADFARDGATIEDLYNPTTLIADLSSDNSLPGLLDERESLTAQKKVIEARAKEIKAELLSKLGSNAGGRLADGRTIVAKILKREAYTVNATEYVDLRVKGASQGASA